MPVGQVVGRLREEQNTAEVMRAFMEEFVDAVERLGGMLAAAEHDR
jgi:hypothetical protein